MPRFVQQNELVRHARGFVENRVNSLESDAKHCLPEDPHDERIAPFPILLYCFATIDLLGALMSGRADRKAPTPEQSIQYMTSYMGYTNENAKILLDLFRHKLVHLAQPNPIIRRDPEVITWRYHHNNSQLFATLDYFLEIGIKLKSIYLSGLLSSWLTCLEIQVFEQLHLYYFYTCHSK
jgi:hypothetical protein